MYSEVRQHRKKSYLFVNIEGEWEEENVKTTLTFIADEMRKQGVELVLIDVTELQAPKNEMIRFHTGENIARIFGSLIKVVAIGKKELINNFAEAVAVNRGARFAVFDNEKEALEWLFK